MYALVWGLESLRRGLVIQFAVLTVQHTSHNKFATCKHTRAQTHNKKAQYDDVVEAECYKNTYALNLVANHGDTTPADLRVGGGTHEDPSAEHVFELGQHIVRQQTGVPGGQQP